MGFNIKKRINLGGGLGINVGKTKASVSLRTKAGSVGSKGVSVKTGVKGINYTSGKSGCLVFILAGTAFLLKYILS
jgi:hypothetical protein